MRSTGHRVVDPFRKWYRGLRTRREEEEEEEEALITLKCVYVDFDGKRLGPISKDFRIPRFERDKPVRSLEVYPLRFHQFLKDGTPDDSDHVGNDFKKYLVSRGRKFLNVAAVRLAAIRPMYYAGPALQTQDEIESQVVVDFEAAFGIEDNMEKGWKPDLETLIKSEDDNKEHSEGNKCQADCCNGEIVHDDSVLEYYAGILFLTTNRVGDFDEAFASRIHISLYYPELGRKETLEVFKLNLQLIRDRFENKPRKFTPDEIEIGAFAQEYWDNNPFDHWNGRQIRNACQTALALAEYEAQGKDHTHVLNPNAEIRLNVSHFKTVADAYLAFSKHLKDIYGTHAARRAKEAGLRA
ncbi:hypothetical protein PC116_g28867, partial [Phytophthora cactorum]